MQAVAWLGGSKGADVVELVTWGVMWKEQADG